MTKKTLKEVYKEWEGGIPTRDKLKATYAVLTRNKHIFKELGDKHAERLGKLMKQNKYEPTEENRARLLKLAGKVI